MVNVGVAASSCNWRNDTGIGVEVRTGAQKSRAGKTNFLQPV